MEVFVHAKDIFIDAVEMCIFVSPYTVSKTMAIWKNV